jgi:hypothetical protein
MVWYEEHKVLVMVRMKANSAHEIEENFYLISQTYNNAVHWLMTNGKSASLHEYTIVDKKVNVVPNLFDSIGQIQTEDRSKTIRQFREQT